MDAQQEHDLQMEQRGKLEKGSGKRLKALLAKKKDSSSGAAPYHGLDPIAMAMQNNPSLTREKAEEMASMLGF